METFRPRCRGHDERSLVPPHLEQGNEVSADDFLDFRDAALQRHVVVTRRGWRRAGHPRCQLRLLDDLLAAGQPEVGAVAQEVLKILTRDRPGEEIALYLPATQLVDQRELLDGL